MFDLVIFDCDGVLVDSEPLSSRIFVEALAELGLTLTAQECVEAFVGRSPKANLETVERLLKGPLPTSFVPNLMAKASVVFSQELQAVPGIKVALEQIQLPVCVASGSSPELIRDNLTITGLLDRFADNIFSSNDVEHGKPAPDVFLYAAKKMQINPDRCAVVEDSIAGVQAGCAAGMTVFAYHGTFSAAALSEAGAHVLFDDMNRLPELLLARLS